MSEAAMVEVRVKSIVIGADEPGADHHPAHTVQVAPFAIDVHPVTCAAYDEFVKDTGYAPPPDWPDGACPALRRAHPVVFVSWFDATAYAEWAGKRLPTEAEWEAAARGGDGRAYPWGNTWEEGRCVVGVGESPDRIVPVGSFPEGASACGAQDLLGNVWEWTGTWYEAYPGGEPGVQDGQKYRVIRGGAAARFYSWPEVRAVWQRGRLFPYGRSAIVGFRCARTL